VMKLVIRNCCKHKPVKFPMDVSSEFLLIKRADHHQLFGFFSPDFKSHKINTVKLKLEIFCKCFAL